MTERQQGRRDSRTGAIRIGRIAGVPIYLNWTWIIVALLIAWMFSDSVTSTAPEIGPVMSYVAGFGFAVLLYASVLLHEISHTLVARAYGLPVRGITLQLLGGVSEIEQEPGSPWREFWVAVVGPLTSLALGGIALLGRMQMDSPPLLALALFMLAAANLLVGAFNLLPGLPLDGGRVLRALIWGISGKPHLGTIVAAWVGRLVAIGVVILPWLLTRYFGGPDGSPGLVVILWSVLIGAFLWAGSTYALHASRIRQRVPDLSARGLARRGVPVNSATALAEAMRRAEATQAGAVVVVDHEGRPAGLVNEASALATPEYRRPWLSVQTVARTMEPGLVLSTELTGEALLRAMSQTPASEYLVVEPDGAIYGVLVTGDVNRAVAKA